MRLEDSPLNSHFFCPFASSRSDLKSGKPHSLFLSLPSNRTATMSSDSDEDELLQMALKEQAQRDLNYGKPSNSRKPVANFVQQPKKPAPPSKQSKGRVADDDDDSEVEMLSISSGDEDNARDPVAASKTRGAAATGRPAREDDRTWDGEEPSRWKHVDEAEVMRSSLLSVLCIFDALNRINLILFY